ncbi:hypothetical protein CERZMDRAFT_53501 [Cercospora zeae-maydis SCOH1-5]|uniref:Acyl-CoA dehydrogenase n=1 Tax=Cercospora zeae-maydis SCOH1-5 TaxID=717836 RepID=A0A6A6F179_9PEZI|nr:hypothetical protein CERZMDRAFT_53501 [Cercospora zeae-maydis SCOH1-5]
MELELPVEVQAFLGRLESFITTSILPLQAQDDNERFFDHRREASRTQWQNQGLPAQDWEDLCNEAKRLSHAAGFFRFAAPLEYGGTDTTMKNLYMCATRYHLASHPRYGGGLSLANDLQSEHSVVGNNPFVIMIYHYGTLEQKDSLLPRSLAGDLKVTFGLTETEHGSDATHMATTARPVLLDDGEHGYEITGNKKWQSGMHHASHCLVFARTSGRAGSATGITAFLVPRDAPGVTVASYEWTLNMPTDHATVLFDKVRVPATAILGPREHGLAIAQTFTHENRIRQAASSCGAARYCIDRSVQYAKQRKVFGKPLASNQAIQWPLVKLSTQEEMLRLLILRTANEMDQVTKQAIADGKKPWEEVERQLGHKIAMCDYSANALVGKAADRAIQIHGGDGYSRHQPFEHIWRHFRRYRITEGSDEIQIRRIAAQMFGYKKISEAQSRMKPSKL